jgi:hypothetical protein
VSAVTGNPTGVIKGSSTVNSRSTLPSSIPNSLANLWVENGAIWSLPNFLIGFTNYAGVASFFSSVKGAGYYGAPTALYGGTPFSAQDLPILLSDLVTVKNHGNPDLGSSFLLWAKSSTMQFVNTLFAMQRFENGRRPVATSAACPVLPFKTLQSFSANSPSGVQTFQAMYMLYIPRQPACGVPGPLFTGTQYDMSVYSWNEMKDGLG